MKIAIQGISGSFHEIAAKAFFGEDTIVKECSSFELVTSSVDRDPECDGGIMAIENSIAGSLLQNYRLLQEGNLFVRGEIFLRIRQNLIGTETSDIEGIREVHSHPMALFQCESFLKKLPNVKLIETEDTAESVRQLAKLNDPSKAAIGSDLAAKQFGMKLLRTSIESNNNNYTRFLIVGKEQFSELCDTDKASIYFETANIRGSLASVLSTIAVNRINISKLQSFPVVGSNWRYYFHCDLEYQHYEDFMITINQLQEQTEHLKILGNYKKGKHEDEG